MTEPKPWALKCAQTMPLSTYSGADALKFSSFLSPCPYVPIFLAIYHIRSLMSSAFTQEDLSRLRAFLNQLPSSSGDSTLPQPFQLTPTVPSQAAPTTISSTLLPSFSPSQILSQATGSTQHGLPPINQLYQSRQIPQQGHPASQSSTQPPGLGFHPFLGNLPSTSLVNQARLASASATLPRRGRRRGAAPQAPVLGRAKRDFFAPCYIDSEQTTAIRFTDPIPK